ncbi:DUF861 domain-containing protein (plasmid) [Arthrobacter sp. TES]|uniref:cupin domain-containing protein n=1 Tax=Paenarthrobacter sp. TYUT067 TaxID=2926245 RepID=UPI0003962B73|nr:cupin domain-containing protein [Paenarthrobacter sp. TYUT067]AOY74058.1 hypothetical protein ARZXY2_4559 [Arthrobacter sp. ZXY-2]ERI35264.1 hypothetical protein M707_22655 [Arthrobacter sp. AK-YN10]MCM0616508.1 cupin domain-containing protein [Paenarthrobacter sp. TYUT067]QOI65616.1 DUF861 domain-containing protein [Arthrobacter sp. TES]
MDKIRKISTATAPLESWQPDGVTVHEGNPNGHGFTLFERTSSPQFGTGIFTSQPSTTTYELTDNEIIYVVEGSATLTLTSQEPVSVTAGDLVFLPKGHTSTWEFHEPFKEIWFLVE